MNKQFIRQRRIGMVFILSMSALCGHVSATQWFAHHIHYDDVFLGEALLVDDAAGIKLYSPHKIYSWFLDYKGHGVDDLLNESMLILLGAGMGGVCLAGLFWWKKKPRAYSTAHGSARWATDDEIKARGMLKSPTDFLEDKAWLKKVERDGDDPRREASSICFAKTEDGTLYYSNAVTHVLGFAPTRSGKGVGMVIPTLLSWTESVVVTDIKGENYQRTGWWRSLFSHVVYFNPTDPNSARFNPLLEIRKGPRAIQDAMNIATILGARPQGKENPFWDGGGRDVLTATILYVMYTQKHKSLSQCITCLMNSEELFESMQMCDLKDKAVQAHLNDSATSFLEQDDKVKGGWVASAMGYLSLWKDPLVAATTSTSDFRLRDIQFARRPMSVFLVIPPGDLDRLSPLVRLFFQQLTDVLCEKLEEDEGEYRHRLLMMMDEFPQFGNMTKIEKALAYTAGYKIRWFIICQGLPQLAKTYGPHNEFLANSHLCLAYRANDPDNAESISKLVGNTTGHKEQEGESGKKSVIGSLNQKSVSQVEFKRELVTPDEAMTMESERILVMESGQYPIKAYRLTYYDDPFFIPRYKNKTWAFPSSPMKDFPSKDVIHDWGTHLPQSMPDVTENPSQNELYQKAVQGGEEPVSNTILKLEVQEIEELEIPVEMSGQQATRHLTTRSIRQEHIQALLEQGVRAGLIDPAQLDAFLGSFPQDDSPSTHESGSFSHEPEPSAPSPPCIEPPQERSVFTEPTTPDVNDVSPDVTSHDDNFLELNAFFDMMEDLPTESSSSLEHESTPARDTVVVEGLDERMANLRAEYEALTHSESTHNSEDQS